MSRLPIKVLAAATLALGMWFVPSFATQGAGANGRQMPHPDRVLLADGGDNRSTVDGQLDMADAVVRAALPR